MKKKRIIIFIGPPGSGKGSLSQWCTRHLGWAQLSTGDLCRKHISDRTDIGQQIDFFIRSGKLISDELMIDMVEEWMLEKFKDLDVLVLDGFPRTVAQAQALDTLLSKEVFSDVRVEIIQLEIEDNKVKERMMARLICSSKECGAVYSKNDMRFQSPMKCDRCQSDLMVRSDDTENSIEHRVAIYHKYVNELLDYYHDKNKEIRMLDADKPLQEVIANFTKTIGVKL